jgi:uncharacterized protein (TIGR02448 family)
MRLKYAVATLLLCCPFLSALRWPTASGAMCMSSGATTGSTYLTFKKDRKAGGRRPRRRGQLRGQRRFGIRGPYLEVGHAARCAPTTLNLKASDMDLANAILAKNAVSGVTH